MNEAQQFADAIITMLRLRGNLDLLPELVEELRREVELSHHEIIVESAIELSTEEIGKLLASISQKLGYQPHLVQHVDPDLLAGIRLHVGDRVIDVTLKHRLEELKNLVH